MTAETTSDLSDAAEVLLWPEEVAALIGVDRTTVTQYLKQARRHEREHRRTEYEIPEPVPDPEGRERWRRRVPGGPGGTVVVNSNRWFKADIDAWRERVRNRPPASRAHDETGKFTGRPGGPAAPGPAGICHRDTARRVYHDHGPDDACPVGLPVRRGDRYADGRQ